MTLYKNAWKENAGREGWIVDEAKEAEEFIEHRFGLRPRLDVLLMSIAVSGKESIPLDGVMAASTSSVSADETEAIVLDSEEDLMLLRVMDEVGFGLSSRFSGIISICDFDSTAKTGVRAICLQRVRVSCFQK